MSITPSACKEQASDKEQVGIDEQIKLFWDYHEPEFKAEGMTLEFGIGVSPDRIRTAHCLFRHRIQPLPNLVEALIQSLDECGWIAIQDIRQVPFRYGAAPDYFFDLIVTPKDLSEV